ncbi:hypothetical protein ACHAXT_000742 [Thalassiosira profunda]
MTADTARRPSRGRSGRLRGGGRGKQLPPAPERSLSRKRAGASGDIGDRERARGRGSRGRGRDRGRHADRASSLPKTQTKASPDKRRRHRARPSPEAAVPPAAEARDDDDLTSPLESKAAKKAAAPTSQEARDNASAALDAARGVLQRRKPASPTNRKTLEAKTRKVTRDASIQRWKPDPPPTTPVAADSTALAFEAYEAYGAFSPDAFGARSRRRSLSEGTSRRPSERLSLPAKVRSRNDDNTPEDRMAKAPTPYTSNVSRKRIESVAGTKSNSRTATKEYAPEPSWKDVKNAVQDETSSNEPPEISSIPTDEIMDSFMGQAKPKSKGSADRFSDDSSSLLDGLESLRVSRETRDQYQLTRLQARIERRRLMIRQPTIDEDGPESYKTRRSSRIQGVRSLYSRRPPCCGDTTANQTSSTVPSIRFGHSVMSSVSGIHSNGNSNGQTKSNESVALSEYRGKLYAKMLHLFQDMAPGVQGTSVSLESRWEDAASVIKDKILVEGRASCASVADLELLQKMTEEEMGRILMEFELENSLVQTIIEEEAPEVEEAEAETDGQDPPEESNEEVVKEVIGGYLPPPPKRIDIHGTSSIVTKFSDVTSNDVMSLAQGFELDEIGPIPSPSSRSVHLPASKPPQSPRSAAQYHAQQTQLPKRVAKDPPTLSPAAAAAASAAASLSSESGLMGTEQPHMHRLPIVLEIPDTIELEGNEEEGKMLEPSGAVDQNQELGQLTDEEDHFHESILNGSKADEEELNEVTSILSHYEEADKKLKEMDDLLLLLRKTRDGKPLDETPAKQAPAKKVTFVVPSDQPFDEMQSESKCGWLLCM